MPRDDMHLFEDAATWHRIPDWHDDAPPSTLDRAAPRMSWRRAIALALWDRAADLVRSCWKGN